MPFAYPHRASLLLVLLCAGGTLLHAQGRGGGGAHAGGMGMPGGHHGGGMGMPASPGMGMPHGGRAPMGEPHTGGGRGMEPHSGSAGATAGRWWDDKGNAKTLGLNGEQQKRMDHVFSENRDVLKKRYETFTKAQEKLDAMKRKNKSSEAELFSQIQATAQARAELEQAYTHMQLQIRGELTPEQAGKLEEPH